MRLAGEFELEQRLGHGHVVAHQLVHDACKALLQRQRRCVLAGAAILLLRGQQQGRCPGVLLDVQVHAELSAERRVGIELRKRGALI